MLTHQIGFMQGRLSPVIDGKIQCFPWDYWEQEFRLAHQLQFSLIEWTLDCDRLHDNPLMTAPGRAQIKTFAEQYQLSLCSVTGDCFMQAPFYKVETQLRAKHLEDLKKIVESCVELTIPNLLIPLVDAGRLENEQQLESLWEGLESIKPLLKSSHTKISFESDFEPISLANFITHFDSSYFGITYDIGNSAALNYNVADELAAYGDRIVHVHVKDRLLGGSTVPLGEGNADIALALNLLKKINYRGVYILQTARAEEGKHAEALLRYRDIVSGCLEVA